MSTRASIRSRSATAGQAGASVDTTGINRDLNTLLQSQLWTETSGGSYADTTSQLYQQLQQIYGTPGSSTSFDAIYNNFTTALQVAGDQARVRIRSRPRWSAPRRRWRKISIR